MTNKKNISIAIIIVGIIGFVWSQNQKKKYLIFEERITSNNAVSRKINAQTGNEYLFSFWGNNETGNPEKWANLEFTYKIETQSGIVVKQDTITAIGSDENEGTRRAANGDDERFVASRSEDIIISTVLIEGDYIDIEVYENLPENTYWFPVLFIAVFITGLVLFLKARNSSNITKTESSKKR